MKVIIQRVRRASVTVEREVVAQIGQGLLILLGIGPGDNMAVAEQLAKKIVNLRIFEDEADKMNFSVLDVQGEALIVSQFTLYADTSRGRRPSFINAAKPELAEPLVTSFAKQMASEGVPTQTGVFGARMAVELINDGPVTIVMEG